MALHTEQYIPWGYHVVGDDDFGLILGPMAEGDDIDMVDDYLWESSLGEDESDLGLETALD